MKLYKLNKFVLIFLFSSLISILAACQKNEGNHTAITNLSSYEINLKTGLSWLEIGSEVVNDDQLFDVSEKARENIDWDNDSGFINNILVRNKSYYIEKNKIKIFVGDHEKSFLKLFPSAKLMKSNSKFDSSDLAPCYKLGNLYVIFDNNKTIDSFFIRKK